MPRPSPRSSVNDAHELERRAIEAASAGDPRRAAPYFAAAAARTRGAVAARHRLSELEMWRAAGDLARTRRLGERLLRNRAISDRERARVLVILGGVALETKRPREALRVLSHALTGRALEPAVAVGVTVSAANASLAAKKPEIGRRLLLRLADRGEDAFPARAWLELQVALAKLDAYGGDLLAAVERLERIRRVDSETQSLLRRQERSVAAAGNAERKRVQEALARRPEPKLDALRAAITVQATRANAERALARGAWPPEEPATSRLPALRTGEALVTLMSVRDQVHAWVTRADRGVIAHVPLIAKEQWEQIATELSRTWTDAAGWPDGVVPTHLALEAARDLEHAALELWTPLWAPLEGLARVAIAVDPALPAVPWSALALAAPPALRPRPRAVTVLAHAASSRPPAWRAPRERVLALSHREASSPLAEREAKAVVRLLGGQWMDAIRLRDDDAREALQRQLRNVRLWHLAAPIELDALRPHASTVLAGREPVPVWWLARRPLALSLLVASTHVSTSLVPGARGEVVGRITPEGPHRVAGKRRAPMTKATEPSGLARLLVGAIAPRLVLRTSPAETGIAAALLGSFYAGLARGDTPAEALFLAQRKAFDEGLHPATWANVTHWGWF